MEYAKNPELDAKYERAIKLVMLAKRYTKVSTINRVLLVACDVLIVKFFFIPLFQGDFERFLNLTGVLVLWMFIAFCINAVILGINKKRLNPSLIGFSIAFMVLEIIPMIPLFISWFS